MSGNFRVEYARMHSPDASLPMAAIVRSFLEV